MFASVAFLDPEDGTVDARQPHPLNDPATPQGIDTFLVQTPAGADSLACWDVCETAVSGEANTIAGILDNQDGTITITLARPITSNAVTTLTYTDDAAGVTRGRFFAHPGNANGDGVATADDVSALIGAIDGGAPLPWDTYSEDFDHSGGRGPADILRVIDLLNGAGDFTPAKDTLIPTCGVCCPQ